MKEKDNASNAENHGKLFGWTLGYNNAVLNSTGDPKGEFGLYGDSFHRAAQVLVARTAPGGSMNSFDVCPIVFLYRHALELQLKSIILRRDDILRLDGKGELTEKDLFTEHSLTKLLRLAGHIVTDEMEWKDKFEEVGGYMEFEQIIKEFDSIDRRSDAFRYPVNKKGEGSVEHNFAFDVHNIAGRLDPILNLLRAAADSLDDVYRSMCEAIGEARQEAMADANYEPYD